MRNTKRRARWWSVVALVGCLAAPASAVEVRVENQYGEPVDRGVFTAHVSLSDGSRLDCASGATVTREGHRFTVIVRRVPGLPDYTLCGSVPAKLGELPVGQYEVEVRAQALDGGSHDAKVVNLAVERLEGCCNADPFLQPSLYLVDKSRSGAALRERIASDPAFRARLGNPSVSPEGYPSEGVWVSYDPLLDPTYMAYHLDHTGEFDSISRNGWACFSAAPPSILGTVIEYYHAALDHYFYTSDEDEIASVDQGRVGPWVRTGHSFRVVVTPGCRIGTMGTMVYRFAGIPGKGPDSHFFTRDRAECGTLHASGSWAIESLPFHAAAPDTAGACGAGSVPVQRLWRPVGDSNHRFTTDAAVVQEMIAKGWVHEGTAMCVVPGS